MSKVKPAYHVSKEAEERTRKIKQFAKDKDILHFWYFPEKSGFYIIKNVSHQKMSEYLKEKNLAGSKVVEVSVAPNLRGLTDPSSYLLAITIDVFIIPKDYDLYETSKGKTWGLGINFYEKDIIMTKFSLVYLQKLMDEIVIPKKYTCGTFIGQKYHVFIDAIKKLKIDTTPYLK